LNNLVPVTLGNIVGGSVMVASVYYLIYHRALAGSPDMQVAKDEMGTGNHPAPD
jgi:hypothetical protein